MSIWAPLKRQKFLLNMLNCLKPGGVAVHTTECNLSSSTNTIQHESLVLYRQRDFAEMTRALTEAGYEVEPLDFRLNGVDIDHLIIRRPPFIEMPHFKVELNGHIATSHGNIVRKPS